MNDTVATTVAAPAPTRAELGVDAPARRRSLSLTARLLLVMGGLIVGTALTLSALSLYLLGAELDRSVQSRLSAAKTLADSAIDARISESARLARAVALDPALQEALARADAPGARAVLDRYAPVEPDALLDALSSVGESLAVSPLSAGELSDARAAAARGALTAGVAATNACRIVAVATYPVQGVSGTAGGVVVALPLQADFVNALRVGTGLETWIYCGDRERGVLTGAQDFQLDAASRDAVLGRGQVALAAARVNGTDVLGYHVPLIDARSQVLGMLGIAQPVAQIAAAREQAAGFFSAVALALAVLVLVEAFVLARLITRPLKVLTGATGAIAAGDLATPVARTGDDEIGVLAQSIETMRVRLAETISALERERNRYRDFLAMVPHEFKTPLAAMAASLELLETEGDWRAPDEHALLASVRRSIIRLQQLVDNLLDSASIQSGQFQVRPETHDLRPIVEEARQSVLPLLAQKRQALEAHLPDDLPSVKADARRITQVFVNLISNAHKYGPNDAPIVLRAAAEGGWVRVSLTDRGPGIPPDRRSDLFRRFGRLGVNGKDEPPGIGLGLAIVDEIVRLHGGRVGVLAAEGGGATLWFTLPLATPAAEDV